MDSPDDLAADGASPPFDVNALPLVSDAVAQAIKAAVGIGAPPRFGMLAREAIATRPGVERWPVKTGQDGDREQVGTNVVNGQDLGAGIVPVTVEELVTARRPADMPDPATRYDAYQAKRAPPAETTIWRLDVTLIAMKLESDGDYHLVLQGASGQTMIGEIPTPTAEFVGDSPWLANIAAARRAVDQRLVSALVPQAFVVFAGRLMPSASVIGAAAPAPVDTAFLGTSTRQPGPATPTPFMSQIPATKARVTGVGFFDTVHGQTGVAPSGIELHPLLKIEWL